MKYPFFTIIMLLALVFFDSLNAKDTALVLERWELCSEQHDHCRPVEIGIDLYKLTEDTKTSRWIYRSHFKKSELPDACVNGNCWIQIGELADSGRIEINNTTIASFSGSNGNPYYVRNQSLMIPLPVSLIQEENTLDISTVDLNQSLFGLRSKNILISDYASVLHTSRWDAFLRTTITQFSAFSLFLLFLGLLVILFLMPALEVFSLLLYSGIASLYLFSFSEAIREWADPLWASAPLHFSIRLLQDWAIFYVVIVFMFNYTQKSFGKNWPKICHIIFFLCVLAFPLCWFFGIHSYSFYRTMIIFCSPMQTIGMFMGLVLALQLKEHLERRILSISFTILLAAQISDHLVFWQVIRGFFFVRFYPVLIVLLFCAIYVRRNLLKSSQLATEAAVGRMMKQVSHDIRSPLSALKVVSQFSSKIDEDIRILLSTSVSRIQEIAEDLLKGEESRDIQVVILYPLIDSLLAEKRLQFSSRKILFEIDCDPKNLSLSVRVQPAVLKRVLSNLLSNAAEAIEDDMNGLVRLSLQEEGRWIKISIHDNGVGIPTERLQIMFERGKSFRPGGKGLGLSYAKEKITEWGGRIEVKSALGKGSTFEIFQEKVDAPDWLLKTVSIRRECIVIILDDDPSIHQIWDQRFKRESIDNAVLHFYSDSELLYWLDTNKADSAIDLFVDYNLSGSEKDGVQIIQSLPSNISPVLVTSQYENIGIQKLAKFSNFKILPKPFVALIHFENIGRTKPM